MTTNKPLSAEELLRKAYALVHDAEFNHLARGSQPTTNDLERIKRQIFALSQEAAQVQQAAQTTSDDAALAYKLRDTFGPFFSGDRSAQRTMKDVEIILSLWRKEIAQEAVNGHNKTASKS